jgi:hypothetical protein
MARGVTGDLMSLGAITAAPGAQQWACARARAARALECVLAATTRILRRASGPA